MSAKTNATKNKDNSSNGGVVFVEKSQIYPKTVSPVHIICHNDPSFLYYVGKVRARQIQRALHGENIRNDSDGSAESLPAIDVRTSMDDLWSVEQTSLFEQDGETTLFFSPTDKDSSKVLDKYFTDQNFYLGRVERLYGLGVVYGTLTATKATVKKLVKKFGEDDSFGAGVTIETFDNKTLARDLLDGLPLSRDVKMFVGAMVKDNLERIITLASNLDGLSDEHLAEMTEEEISLHLLSGQVVGKPWDVANSVVYGSMEECAESLEGLRWAKDSLSAVVFMLSKELSIMHYLSDYEIWNNPASNYSVMREAFIKPYVSSRAPDYIVNKKIDTIRGHRSSNISVRVRTALFLVNRLSAQLSKSSDNAILNPNIISSHVISELTKINRVLNY